MVVHQYGQGYGWQQSLEFENDVQQDSGVVGKVHFART
jgi:hypothetical protein